VFPADYGFIPDAWGTDGEPLDALVLVGEPTYPGVRVRARLVGVIWVRTGHGREAKLVCIYRDLDRGKEVSFDGSDGRDIAAQVLEHARR
jgi:inorganic pyrophosphatase